MKKGFTLIELLAIIVLLAIISLIIVPIAIDVISNTKVKSYKRSAELYIDAVRTTIVKENLYKDLNPSICEVQSNGNIKCDNEEIQIEIKGKRPSEGRIYFEDGKIIDYKNLLFDDRYVTKNSSNTKLIVSGEKYFMCRPVTNDNATYQSDGKTLVGKIPEGNIELGDEYICDVNEEKSYHFYVISKTDSRVSLILDRNILANGDLVSENNYSKNAVQWVSLDDYKNVGGTEIEYGANGNYNRGPITALKHLNSATKNWNYINPINRKYSSKIDTNPIKYTITLTGRTRMVTYSEIINSGCIINEEKSCPLWLVNNLQIADHYPTGNSILSNNGYWSMDAYQFSETHVVWMIFYNGLTTVEAVNNLNYGIRPVIEVRNSDINGIK